MKFKNASGIELDIPTNLLEPDKVDEINNITEEKWIEELEGATKAASIVILKEHGVQQLLKLLKRLQQIRRFHGDSI